jgi:phospholipid-translocating ATPase
MLWANTVLASGHVLGLVVYTGKETRSALNRNTPQTKRGHTELEVNVLTKILFVMLFLLALVMVALQRFAGTWLVALARFIVMFSSVIPISMRVNLDMAKLVYSFFIMMDKSISGAIVRNSNLPEEMGRISYVLTDKTGTLTRNEMVFKKLHIGALCYRSEDMDELRRCVHTVVRDKDEQLDLSGGNGEKSRRQMKITKGINATTLASLRAAALCHNVTPVVVAAGDGDGAEAEAGSEVKTTYQASSPDEVALVEFTESVGMKLVERDLHEMTILINNEVTESYEILEMFPFSSATKRMGIVLKNGKGEITFLIKGADVVMERLVKKDKSEWMGEETDNMAREGLRTLVFGKKTFTDAEYQQFSSELHEAKCNLIDRDNAVRKVLDRYEGGLDLLCITGVEDKLQTNVRSTLETLSNAGIKTWMLTGDKVETATCIALSSRLFKPADRIYTLCGTDHTECFQKLADFADVPSACLVIDGGTLQICLDNFPIQFITAAKEAPAVVCCRCSPTQKAMVVSLIKEQVKEITCAIGDGGNDVSMILAADVGVGLEGKEGKQASLAADYSLLEFQHLSKLLLWHGRNSYKRSCNLAQFIIHRGLIISILQFIFSVIFNFAAVAIYQGWLAVGYVTYYTMLPVFSLVLDQDVRLSVATDFPELYSDLRKGRQLGFANFFIWVFISVYQGGAIMLLTMYFFENNMNNIVSITFTCVVMIELLNMIFVVHTWTWPLVAAEVFTVMMYYISMILLPTYFGMIYLILKKLFCYLNIYILYFDSFMTFSQISRLLPVLVLCGVLLQLSPFRRYPFRL